MPSVHGPKEVAHVHCIAFLAIQSPAAKASAITANKPMLASATHRAINRSGSFQFICQNGIEFGRSRNRPSVRFQFLKNHRYMSRLNQCQLYRVFSIGQKGTSSSVVSPWFAPGDCGAGLGCGAAPPSARPPMNWNDSSTTRSLLTFWPVCLSSH